MNPAPPVTSTFIAITVMPVLHPPTYTVLLRRVSTTRRMSAVVLTCR